MAERRRKRNNNNSNNSSSNQNNHKNHNSSENDVITPNLHIDVKNVPAYFHASTNMGLWLAFFCGYGGKSSKKSKIEEPSEVKIKLALMGEHKSGVLKLGTRDMSSDADFGMHTLRRQMRCPD